MKSGGNVHYELESNRSEFAAKANFLHNRNSDVDKLSSIIFLIARGDKKGTQCPGYNWASLFLGDINTGTWPSRLGESQMRQ
jgi:hypothetical protein